MPNTASEQEARHTALREMLRNQPVTTQQALVDALTGLGLSATQSSVSRDLKELGAIKTSRGYELPVREHDGDEELAKVGNLIRGATPAGVHLLVITTAIGAAQRVALAFDRAEWPEIVGSIGGDDTVFVATASASGQKHLVNRIERARAL